MLIAVIFAIFIAVITGIVYYIKKNKNKIIAVFTLVLGALAGDSVGVFDYISAWFGF